MKQTLLLAVFSAALMAAGASLAMQNTTGPGATDRAVPAAVTLSPQDLADDICWVAPEWRDR